jgi:hypothetical protein
MRFLQPKTCESCVFGTYVSLIDWIEENSFNPI